MNVFKAIAIAACAVSFIPVEAEAQALRNVGEPAEFPPSSYTGRQYVDSNGCAFIRAGIDGNVTWVPRVTRSRELSCGFQPSLVARAPAPEPNVTVAAAPQTAQPTVRVAQAQPTAETVRVVPSAAPQAVVPVRRVAALTVTAPRSAPVLAAPVPVQPTVQTATRRAPAQLASANCGGSALSRQYMQSSTHSVRCGPQREDHVTRLPSAAPSSYVPRTAPAPNYAQTAQVLTPDTRIAPRHVVREQRLSTQGVSIPEGYKRVWMDGRLNPQRAHQTYAGKAQMDLMWTRTTPRRLIDRQTGREVTALHPGLKYPYTSYAAQPEHVTQKRLAAPQVTMSSRTLPVAAVAAAEPARAASHRFVQAGVYRTRAQAEVEARRVASMGLPARLGTMRHNGQDVTMVLAGPFNSQSALNSAMTRVRGAGFGNAVLRK
ncbi:MAG: SPOR domain-containing protein [Roseovarius sp.]